MPLLLRRSAAAVALVLTAAACGQGSADDARSAARLDAVTVSGDVGSDPEVTWKSRMSASSVESDTLIEGDGAAVADGESVLAQIWIGNGFSQTKSYSSYDEDKAQLITTEGSTIPALRKALEGATIGSRIAVTASADEAFGSETGNPSLGIGNQDSVLLILDVLTPVDSGPTGAAIAAPGWAPTIVEAEGVPSSFDFTAAPQPTGRFRKAELFAGDGPVIERNQTVVVRYLGQTYAGAAPFDQNYTTQPSVYQIGNGSLIQGWDRMVVGSKVGSRILIEVPPKLGYGANGSPDAGITGTDTLFFVIDILAAA